jgi:lysine 2,3-aminomutase
MKEKAKKRLLSILESIPPLKKIMVSPDPLEKKRKKVRELMNTMLIKTYDDNPNLPSLAWLLTRDAIVVFRNLVSRRSEKISGFRFLGYLNDVIHEGKMISDNPPSLDFFAELSHLFHGISGRADVYPQKAPAFSKYHGEKAAKLRSIDLSRMARHVEKFSKRYACGLDDSVKRRRYNNKLRILDHFEVTDFEWSDWRWHMRHIIRDVKTLNKLIKLTDEEHEAVRLAQKHKIPFGITPYYLSLMDYEPGQGRDRAIRAQVLPSLKYIQKIEEFKADDIKFMDFMLERDTSPIEGITRRYPQIVILKPVLTCPQFCVYCQRNWEIEDVYSGSAILPKPKLEKAIQWIAQTPEINEVLITGGDPFILSNERIESLLYKLSRIEHIQRIRLGTRTPVTLPQRITDALVKDINHFHIPGKREVLIVTHVEHPYELTHNAMEAVQRFRRYGIDVYNQMVYTFYNSRKFEAAVLRHYLRLIGITPYYTFNTKGKEETDEYRVPIPRLLQEQKEEARLMPGTVRTDEIVFNVPGLGKNYLRAIQHHDVISILPNGRRVYEFHPWEKKMALADTYVYTDVSIYEYMQRLKAIGENISDYKSIWYYY